MSGFSDLETQICDVHTLALLIDDQIEDATQNDNEKAKPARAALYYLMNNLMREVEMLRSKFYEEAHKS